MNFQRLAKQVVIRLPTDIEKLEEDEINKIVGAYVSTHGDFILLKRWVKRLSKERNRGFYNRTITYAEFLKGKTRY